MSDDPETLRQIEALSHDSRPLLVVDVDEVLLEFVRPFMAYLDDKGHYLKTDSFRLNGNVIDQKTGQAVEAEKVSLFIEGLFAEQQRWQGPVEGAAEALEKIGNSASIVMLTAMPHRHHETRRALLNSFGMPYPLITTEAAKGPAIMAMRGHSGRPVAFVDDIPHNHVSVQKSLPDAALFHLMSYEPFKDVLPPLPEYIIPTNDWPHAHDLIGEALGI